jgi:NADPH:quinone reductase-like Zn-dependent oxidoreductase
VFSIKERNMSQGSGATITMKAVRIHAFGGPEELRYEDTPRPLAGTGEVLIRIHASAVNPADWKLRSGIFGKDIPLPLTLGFDFSGVIEALGEGVTRWKIGDEVYGYGPGAYAEYIAVKQTLVAAKPKTVDHIHAAAIASASLTAWKALFDEGGLLPGQKVLIHGATGGVGGFAVQLAHAKGAHVIGTASKRNQAYLRELGANEAIDYESVRFEDVVRDVDVVFDTQGGTTQARSWQTLKRGGILVSIAQPPAQAEAERHGVRATFMVNEMKPESLDAITQLVDSGKLKAVVDTVLPLSEARRAQELIQSGHTRGKIALKVV